ncbi:unnamed protein product [Closterium sp. Naga37s-1]|nr:unnamed protein product [Closterium sp. Naga37s-1]
MAHVVLQYQGVRVHRVLYDPVEDALSLYVTVFTRPLFKLGCLAHFDLCVLLELEDIPLVTPTSHLSASPPSLLAPLPATPLPASPSPCKPLPLQAPPPASPSPCKPLPLQAPPPASPSPWELPLQERDYPLHGLTPPPLPPAKEGRTSEPSAATPSAIPPTPAAAGSASASEAGGSSQFAGEEGHGAARTAAVAPQPAVRPLKRVKFQRDFFQRNPVISHLPFIGDLYKWESSCPNSHPT